MHWDGCYRCVCFLWGLKYIYLRGDGAEVTHKHGGPARVARCIMGATEGGSAEFKMSAR